MQTVKNTRVKIEIIKYLYTPVSNINLNYDKEFLIIFSIALYSNRKRTCFGEVSFGIIENDGCER